MIILPSIRCPGCGRMMPQAKAKEVPPAKTYRDCLRRCTHCRIGASNAKNLSKVKFIHAVPRPGEAAPAAPAEQPQTVPEPQPAQPETAATVPPVEAAAAPQPEPQPDQAALPAKEPPAQRPSAVQPEAETAAPQQRPQVSPPAAGLPPRPSYDRPRGGRQYDGRGPRRFNGPRGDKPGYGQRPERPGNHYGQPGRDDRYGEGRPRKHFGPPRGDGRGPRRFNGPRDDKPGYGQRPERPGNHYGPPGRDDRYGEGRPRKHFGPPRGDDRGPRRFNGPRGDKPGYGQWPEHPGNHYGPPRSDDRPWQPRGGKPYGRPGHRKFGGDSRGPRRPHRD